MFQFVSVGSREFAVIVRMQRFHDILFEFLFSSVGNIKYLSGFLLYNCFLSFFKSSYITILKSYAVVKTGKCIWLFFSGHISKDSLWFAECVELPSSCLPPLQSESKCEVFLMKISCHSYVK